MSENALPLQSIKAMKMLGHRFDLAGVIDLSFEQMSLSFELEGFFKEITNKESYLSFEQFVLQYPADPQTRSFLESTLDTLAFSNQSHLCGSDVIQRLQDSSANNHPHTISIVSGWDQHAVGVVIHDDKLYICNRGQGSDGEHGIIEYRIGNMEGLTETLIDRLISASGSPYFLQTELFEQLSLTEIERYDAPPQTVGNCAWTNAIENIHATLLAQYSDNLADKQEAIHLANTLYQEWVSFDLNQALAQLPHFESDPYQHEMIDAVLSKILSTQHDASDPQHIQRALYILPHFDDPMQQLKTLEDPAFEAQVNAQMQKYVQIYEQSHWYDTYFYSLSDYFSGNSKTHQYQSYMHDVHLGKELSELGMVHNSPINGSTSALRWEDVFPDGNGMYCHNTYIPPAGSVMHDVIMPVEYVHGLI